MEAPESTDKAPAPQPTPLEYSQLPEWLQGTPNQALYHLIMFGEGGSGIEEVPMSREEYVSLKVRLAELRGISLSDEQVDALDNTPYDNDPDRTKLAAA